MSISRAIAIVAAAGFGVVLTAYNWLVLARNWRGRGHGESGIPFVGGLLLFLAFVRLIGGWALLAFVVDWGSVPSVLVGLRRDRLLSRAYATACELTESAAAEKLGRALTPDERAGIWNAGSLMMLEALDRSIQNANDPAVLSAELVSAAKAAEAARQRGFVT